MKILYYENLEPYGIYMVCTWFILFKSISSIYTERPPRSRLTTDDIKLTKESKALEVKCGKPCGKYNTRDNTHLCTSVGRY